MKTQNIFTSVVLALSASVAMSNSAKAGTFVTNFSPSPVTDPTADIILNSIIRNDGRMISDFQLVTSVNIIKNGGVSGTVSTDKGDTATSPGFNPNENPSAREIAAYLGNNNLNNIIDSEDKGEFELDVFFDSAVLSDNTATDSFFFWERGLNSSIQLQALDERGNLIGNAFTIDKSLWEFAGFQIKTTEITQAQNVGAFGVSFGNLGLTSGTLVSGLKLIAFNSFNGPDFKLLAHTSLCCTPIPEPATMMGLGAVAGLMLMCRRQIRIKKI
ncbi:PEP-CTERM sorting domain-containing protein [Nostoc sp. CENA543]|uniref:exosortase-dependent surface protein XDP2 n=1 Tax=Nostoc sp. CENA543 TaxID=1869241 RepID=UPI000CA1E739|nr:exosortase-dependent surface protein XDP2 [Nostoc sp. CENA543]AUS99266.1 PEP-CTERM sorting domain-containing protein [Nostoc sp. CENA543]